MIYSTATVSVNPAGEVPLTRAQVWQGLERKARDARLFLPPGLCTRCNVTEESATHFVREATIAGQDLREIIVLEPGTKVTFSVSSRLALFLRTGAFADPFDASSATRSPTRRARPTTAPP